MRGSSPNRLSLGLFVLSIAVFAVLAVSGERHAIAFSVDVQPSVLASITGHSNNGVAVPAATRTTGRPTVTNPAAPAPGNGAGNPNAPSGTAGSTRGGAATPPAPGGHNWATIILATVVSVGVLLIVLYFVTRERED
jgi:hypothetical protein